MPLEICILAGGLSERMGVDKTVLRLRTGETFLQKITALAKEITPNIRVIREDAVARCGPLGGIYTALRDTNAESIIFLSCDMPLVSSDILWKLVSIYRRVPVPVFTATEGAGFPFLLPSESKAAVEQQIHGKQFSIQKLREAVHGALYEPLPIEKKLLVNINTPKDYQRLTGTKPAVPVLEVENLAIRRDKVQIVSDLNWRIQPGEHWVILGANGSGKTSLLSALLGYMSPTSGDIRLLGEEFGQSDWRALRNKIGLVSSSIRQMMPEHEPALITVASGAHAMIDYWGEPSKAEKIKATRILKQIEADYAADRPWYCLSQGERQRVLIGRALMAEPKLLILDEPCAGLDPAAREKFLQFINRLGQRKNSPALVLVTHHVEEIMPVFTHGLLLKQGRSIAQERLSQVLNSENLSETFSAELQLRKRDGRYSLEFPSH